MSPEESRQDEIIEKLTKENESLRQRLEKAEKENERLRKLLEEALRSLKRQAAPFSKGKPKSDPKSRWLSPGNFAVFLPVKLPCGTPLIYAGLSLLGIMIDNPHRFLRLCQRSRDRRRRAFVESM